MQAFSPYDILNQIDYDIASECLECSQNSSNIIAKVTPDTDSIPFLEAFEELYELLGIEGTYSYITFDPETFERKFISTPVFGMKDEQLAFYYGDNSEYLIATPENSHSKPYTLNGVPLKLKEVKGEMYDRRYIVIETENYELYLTFVLDKNLKKVDPKEIHEFWKNSKLQFLLKDISQATGYGINLSKAFALSIPGSKESNLLPMSGIVLVLKNGTINRYEDPATGKVFPSSKWDLVYTTHPNIEVLDYYENIIKLGDVNKVQASGTSTPTNYLTFQPGETYQGLYLLWIKDFRYVGGKVKADWMPEHLGKVYRNSESIPPRVKALFPQVSEYCEANGTQQAVLEPTPKDKLKTLKPFDPSSSTPTERTTSEIEMDDLPF